MPPMKTARQGCCKWRRRSVVETAHSSRIHINLPSHSHIKLCLCHDDLLFCLLKVSRTTLPFWFETSQMFFLFWTTRRRRVAIGGKDCDDRLRRATNVSRNREQGKATTGGLTLFCVSIQRTQSDGPDRKTSKRYKDIWPCLSSTSVYTYGGTT